ncbi:MAG TPA: DUF2127 domain-containing protein [Candidatus Peribacteraceae bacterium]|nr:DUF2127 domain-containing protein [Candidatus Peribacteraceae bacterium]
MRRIKALFQENVLHGLFEIGILIKAIDGVLECIGGLLFLFVSRQFLYSIVTEITEHELSQDPNDILANTIVHAVANLPEGTKIFGAVYLLIHGLVKIGMVIGLWKDKLWAYPVSLSVLGIFVAYQIYRFTHTHSILLAAFTVLDVVIMLLIWHEWNYHRKKLQSDTNADASL